MFSNKSNIIRYFARIVELKLWQIRICKALSLFSIFFPWMLRYHDLHFIVGVYTETYLSIA